MRLGDLDALKNEVENLVVGGEKGLKNYYENGSKSDENSWIGGVYDAWELIDNAPTVHHPNCDICEDKAKQYSLGFQDGYLTGKERPQDEWIPVSERLPEIATACIVQLSNGYITMGKYHSIRGGSWVFIDTTIQFVYPKDSVIAWQPLPEPYKEEGEEQ